MTDEQQPIPDPDEHILVADGNKVVCVWAWEDAPEEYRKHVRPITGDYGGEKWMALIPTGYAHDLAWIEQSSYFAVESLDVYTLSSGQRIYVGT